MANMNGLQLKQSNETKLHDPSDLREVRLCIAAATQFGQYISIAYTSLKQLPLKSASITRMSYENPGFWTMTLKSVGTFLRYKYLLQYEKFGTEAVWECGPDRQYDFSNLSSLSTYVLIRDVWRVNGDSIRSIFSTTAFTRVLFPVEPIVGKRHYEAIEKASFTEALIHPPGAFVVVFRVFIERVAKGDCLFVVGDCRELGGNDTSSAVSLVDTFSPIWQASIPLLEPNNHIKYRFFIRRRDSTIIDDALQRELMFNNVDQSFLASKPGKVPVVYAPFERPFSYKKHWTGAGIVFPVFSIRSRRNCGIGEFSDLIPVVDFCKATGYQILQLLPVYDTVAQNGTWESNPYSIVSGFALHPQYISIDDLGTLPDGIRLEYESERNRLNRIKVIDTMEVMKVKNRFIREMFKLHRNEFLKSTEFTTFFQDNCHWLIPYALFRSLMHVNGTSQFNQWGVHSQFSPDTILAFSESDSFLYDHLAVSYYTQFHLDKQLKKAADYAIKNGIVLKGDVPIGVNHFSVDTWVHPQLFRLNMQAGSPPNPPIKHGQIYSFPPHNWEVMRDDNYTWWRSRVSHLSKYFQALHIRHSHSLVHFWEVPKSFQSSFFGRFYPSYAISRQELDCLGLWDIDRYIKPYINDNILQKCFHVDWWKVKDKFFEPLHDNRLQFKIMFDSEKKIENAFRLPPNAPDSERRFGAEMKNNLLSLFNNICLLRDEDDENKFYPRFLMQSTSSYAELPSEDWKRALSNLQKDYMTSRQNELWKQDGLTRFMMLRDAHDMLICCGDFEKSSEPLAFIMNESCSLDIRSVSLENTECRVPTDYIYECVATTSLPDTGTLRTWWEEIPTEIRERYWTQVLHQNESQTVPSDCTVEIVEQIVRSQLQSPAIWAIFPIQDLLSMNEQFCREDAKEEQLNGSCSPPHLWDVRIHIDVETLLESKNFIRKLKELNQETGRGCIY